MKESLTFDVDASRILLRASTIGTAVVRILLTVVSEFVTSSFQDPHWYIDQLNGTIQDL